MGAAEDDDDEQGGGLGPVKKSKASNKNGDLLSLPPTNASSLSRQQRLKQQQAKELDATVFEYDEVYDDMKDAERKTKAAKDALGQERKVSSARSARYDVSES